MDGDLTKRNHTRQSHIIVNARYALTRAEIDIVLTLLTSISKEDEDFKDYKFTIGELQEKTGREWNSKQLKDTVKSLMTKPLELPTEDSDWEIVNWFSYFKYEKHLITCRFDKRLKPYLLEIIGTRILADFRHILPMKSSYSKRMYLLLKQYNKIGSRTFEVEHLQDILKVPNSHKLYSNFKLKVLKRAETDINKFTDLEVKLTEKKRARKVVEITYTIKKNHTDLKTFISVIRELYTNTILHFSKENRPIMCSEKGFLYYSDDEKKAYIDQKEAQKLWEYLHENRENLYVFKKNSEELQEHVYLSNIEYFKAYLKDNFVHKRIAKLKRGDEILDISIFPNGRLYEMNGEQLDSDMVWKILYKLGKEGRLEIFDV